MPFDLQGIIGVVDAVANSDKRYTTNKRRGAVVAYESFRLSDFVSDNRGSIHVVSGCLSVLFAYICWIRRENGAESFALWSSLSLASGYVWWITRDAEAVVSNGDGTYSKEVTAVEKVKALLDARAEELDKTDPGWDKRTEQRVLGSL